MKSTAAACVALGLIALLHHELVNAQARGESVVNMQERLDIEPAHEATVPDLDAWLRRLVGRFNIISPLTREITARMDCTSIGSGPGVQCVSRSVGRQVNRDTPGPAFVLYGVDPDLPGIRTLRVSGLSIADYVEGGKLRGDKVTFASACPLPPNVPSSSSRKSPTPYSCWHQTIIEAPPDSDSVVFKFTTQMGMIMASPERGSNGGTSQPFDRTRTVSASGRYEWQRLADDDPSEPVLTLESQELEALEQYGKAEIPELVGHLVDQAGRLAPEQRADLESKLAAYEASTSQRVVVVTTNKLNGQSIEAFARRAVTAWQLGSEERSDFVLIAIAPNDGAARIESGAAMRTCLPDDTAQQILVEAMVPDFQYQRYAEGLAKGVARVMAACRELQPEAAEQ